MALKINKTCDGCDEKGIYNKFFNKYICKNCKELNSNYILITRTNAKKQFLLTNNDLDTIEPFTGKTSSTYGPATYFVKINLIDLACIKHDVNSSNLENKILNIITEKNNKKEANRLKKEEKNKKLEIKRKNKLIINLENAGLKLRNDSILCKKYINGDNDFSLEEIIERMSQMKYLYEYCHMDECKSIASNLYCKELNAGYFPDFSITEHAEYLALKKYSYGKYPDVYPWQIVT